MHREEVIKEAEKRLSSVSFQLESGGNLNAGLRKIKEREYKFLRGVVFALRAQQPPAKLDRSRWEGCNECHATSCATCAHYERRNTRTACTTSCIKYSKHEPVYFCKNCGRPLTEEAWAELERRINDGAVE